jgi:phage shock protein C
MNMQENTSSQEKKEAKKIKGSYFEVPGIPISDIKGESGMKSEEKVEEKKTTGNSAPFETKEPTANEFTAPGEIETGYIEKSWEKPEKSMEEKAAERTEGVIQETVEEVVERIDLKSREKETGEREAREAREKEDKEAREKEDKEARERETREKDAREEKRTSYTMEKRLTKSKTERKLFGVCGGLGEYFGIDPTLVRLAFVLLAVLHGIGLILYIVLAIIMPSEKNVEMVPSYRM